jgi:hypothetical protein
MTVFYDPNFARHPDPAPNSTLKWCGSDGPQAYANYQPNPYTPDEIEYVFNGDKYRCDAFDAPAQARILFMGCSFTEGIGLKLPEVWSHRLLQHITAHTGIQIPYWSIAVGGAGLDSQIRALVHVHERLKPDIIFALFPPYRKEYRKFRTGMRWASLLADDNERILSQNPFLLEPDNISYETEKNMTILSLIADRYDSLVIWDTWDTDFPHIDTGYLPRLQFSNIYNTMDHSQFNDAAYARDGCHPGAVFHEVYSDLTFQKYQDKIKDRL